MSSREAYEKKLQAQLDEWHAEIDKLRAKAKKASAQAQIDAERHVATLESKRNEAMRQMETFRQAGEGAWTELRAGLEMAWQDLAEAVKSARSKFD